jgi:hypothetical protein
VTLQELMALGEWKSHRMVLKYAHLAPQNAASAAQSVGTQVAQSMPEPKTVSGVKCGLTDNLAHFER